MEKQTQPTTADDLDRCDWRSIPNASPRRSCWHYSRLYHERARAVEDQADGCAPVLDLLGMVTAVTLQFDVRNQPFAPVAILDRLPDDGLALLAERANSVEDPELRARLKDLAWVTARNHQLGRQAVTEYLLSATTLAAHADWAGTVRRIERALRLASELRDEAKVAAVVAHVDAILDAYEPSHEMKFLAANLMELLLEFSQGDAEARSALAERIALYAEEERRWDRAETHWQLKARWDERRSETETARQARIRATETHVAAAVEALAGNPNYIQVSNELLRAVEGLRRLGERDRADELRRRALAYQGQARAQADRFSVEFDFGEFADAARQAVSGKSLREALITLAGMGRPPRVETLRRQTEEEIELAPIQHMIAAVQHDDRGRATARRPPHGSGNESQEAAAMEASMLANAEVHRGGQVMAFVEPARRRIFQEHQPRLRDLLDLAADSPFVPEGREAIFAEGLHAGLVGDFLVAGHLLPPQIEHSIRHLLEQRGNTTSSLSSDSIQEDFSLTTLFGPRHLAFVVEVFGEDLTFDLRGLLIERWGANLRNRVAHGLMSHAEFASTQVVYLWWLTLRLCCWHLLATAHPHAAGPPAEGGDEVPGPPPSVEATKDQDGDATLGGQEGATPSASQPTAQARR